MGYVLHCDLDASVPPASRSPSPPCSRSSLPRGCPNPAAEGGDSLESVEGFKELKVVKLNVECFEALKVEN